MIKLYLIIEKFYILDYQVISELQLHHPVHHHHLQEFLVYL